MKIESHHIHLVNANRRGSHISSITGILEYLGEDVAREGLLKTPERHLKSLEYLTSGYKEDPEQIIKSAIFHEDYKDMIIIRDVEFYSMCEHHMLPFHGRCHVGYIPNGKIVGLSKVPRVIDAFAKRLQVQERLTTEIAGAIQNYLQPLGVGVVIEAYHMCMMMRGVKKQDSFTQTSCMQGTFQKSEIRSEFITHIRAAKPNF